MSTPVAMLRLSGLALLACGLAACDRPTVPSGWPAGTTGGLEAGTFTRVDAATPLVPVNRCNLETLDNGAFADPPVALARDAHFEVRGYAFDAVDERVPSRLRLRAIAADGSAFEAPLRIGIDRPDVPAYFKIGGWARRSGFDSTLSAASLAAGEYRLLLTYTDADGATVYGCDNGRKLRIGD